jgi:hypothetical protein
MRKIYLPFITTYSYTNLWFVYYRNSPKDIKFTIAKKDNDGRVTPLQRKYNFLAKTFNDAFAGDSIYPVSVTIIYSRRGSDNGLGDDQGAI